MFLWVLCSHDSCLSSLRPLACLRNSSGPLFIPCAGSGPGANAGRRDASAIGPAAYIMPTVCNSRQTALHDENGQRFYVHWATNKAPRTDFVKFCID